MDYLSNLEDAFRRQQGQRVSRLITITHKDLVAFGSWSDPALAESSIKQIFSDPTVAEIAYLHWKVAYSIVKKSNVGDAFSNQNALVGALNRLASKSKSWILPPLFVVVRELREIAVMADSQVERSKSKQDETQLEVASRTINRSFTICLNDREPDLVESKKWGVYFLVSILFRIYFKLNKRSLAKSLIKALDANSARMPALNLYPKAHVVTYLYYTGRIHFSEGDYSKAYRNLQDAFDQCSAKAHGNKEQILLYLIPLKVILHSHLPSITLYKEYPRLSALYRPLLDYGLRQGNLCAFDHALQERESFLIHRQLYTVMDMIRVSTRLQLFKTIYRVLGKPNRIPVRTFTDGVLACAKIGHQSSSSPLLYTGDDENTYGLSQIDDDQIECYLATLILPGRIKGYISREKRTVVLHNTNPFPAPNQV